MNKFYKWFQLAKCSKLKPTERILLMNVLGYHNLKCDGKWNNTPQSVLAENIGCNRTMIFRNMKRLQSMGLVDVVGNAHGNGMSTNNDYIPNMKMIDELIDASATDETICVEDSEQVAKMQHSQVAKMQHSQVAKMQHSQVAKMQHNWDCLKQSECSVDVSKCVLKEKENIKKDDTAGTDMKISPKGSVDLVDSNHSDGWIEDTINNDNEIPNTNESQSNSPTVTDYGSPSFQIDTNAVVVESNGFGHFDEMSKDHAACVDSGKAKYCYSSIVRDYNDALLNLPSKVSTVADMDDWYSDIIGPSSSDSVPNSMSNANKATGDNIIPTVVQMTAPMEKTPQSANLKANSASVAIDPSLLNRIDELENIYNNSSNPLDAPSEPDNTNIDEGSNNTAAADSNSSLYELIQKIRADVARLTENQLKARLNDLETSSITDYNIPKLYRCLLDAKYGAQYDSIAVTAIKKASELFANFGGRIEFKNDNSMTISYEFMLIFWYGIETLTIGKDAANTDSPTLTEKQIDALSAELYYFKRNLDERYKSEDTRKMWEDARNRISKSSECKNLSTAVIGLKAVSA